MSTPNLTALPLGHFFGLGIAFVEVSNGLGRKLDKRVIHAL